MTNSSSIIKLQGTILELASTPFSLMKSAQYYDNRRRLENLLENISSYGGRNGSIADTVLRSLHSYEKKRQPEKVANCSGPQAEAAAYRNLCI